MTKPLWPSAFIASAFLVALAAPASAASWLEKNFWLSGPRYDAIVPSCDSPAAQHKIIARFAEKEAGFWKSDLQIVEFLRVREVAFRPWAVHAIPRRFCTGVVLVSDGRTRRVHYSIIEDGGTIGASWGVEWCVVGLDRNSAYSPGCRMALP